MKEMPDVHQQMIHLVLRIFEELKQVLVTHLERVINKSCQSPLVFERKRRTRINKSWEIIEDAKLLFYL